MVISNLANLNPYLILFPSNAGRPYSGRQNFGIKRGSSSSFLIPTSFSPPWVNFGVDFSSSIWSKFFKGKFFFSSLGEFWSRFPLVWWQISSSIWAIFWWLVYFLALGDFWSNLGALVWAIFLFFGMRFSALGQSCMCRSEFWLEEVFS